MLLIGNKSRPAPTGLPAGSLRPHDSVAWLLVACLTD
jgi:hypothetical protein